MLYAPINGITWTIGGIATSRFGIRGFQTFKETRNPIAKIYGYLGILLGVGFFLFGIPALLTENIHILKYTALLADVAVEIGMQTLVWLVWQLGLRNYLRLRYLLTVSITYSLILLVYEALTIKVSIDYAHHIVNYIDRPLVLSMQGIIYLVLSIPLGFYFLSQVPAQSGLNAKLKNFMNAMIYFIVSIAATANNIFDKGSDTPSSSVVLGIFFIAFLIVSLLPRKQETQKI